MRKSAKRRDRSSREPGGRPAIAYTSTIRGVEESETGQPRTYYGIVMRTPGQIVKSGFTHPDWKQALDDQQAQVEKLVAELEERGSEVGRIWERIEAFDATTREIIVLYRVPVVVSDPAKKKGYMAHKDFHVGHSPNGVSFEFSPDTYAGLKALADRLARATGLPVSVKTVLAAYTGLWANDDVAGGFFDMSSEAEQMVKEMVILFWDDPEAHDLFMDDQAPKQ